MRSVRAFLHDRSGSYAVILGTLLLPVVFAVGTAVDFNRASNIRADLQNSLDAAVMAGVAVLGSGEQKAKETAEAFFTGNDTLLTGVVAPNGEPLKPTFTIKNGTMSGSVSYSMPTAFMKLAKIDAVAVSAQSSASATGRGMELALVVDVSSSMEDGNKIQMLRDAAVGIIDKIYGTTETRPDTWVSIVPFDGRVNISTYGASWIDTSLVPKKASYNANCVGLRSTTNRTNDALPETEKFPPYLTGKDYGSSSTCGGSKVVGWTTSKTTVRNALANLKTGYGTSIWEGAAWGYRMLSPKWKGKWGDANLPLSYEETPRKIMILMTDGENTPGDYGDPFNTTTANTMQVSTCTAMKAEGITIYSVAFDITSSAAQPLKDCATSPNHYFQVPRTEGLTAVFTQIGADLAKGTARLIN